MVFVVLVALSWGLGAGRASAAGTGTSLTVALNPASIPANGSSTTTVTATVHDSSTPPAGVTGDTVTFTASDTTVTIGTVTDNQDGTYKATVTSSTTAGKVTITATDTSETPNLSGTATLTQTGPASAVAVQLSPSVITANGTSTSTATATVTDANGNPIPGETIGFKSSDTGNKFAAATGTTDASGSYSTTITSSTTVGTATITAADGAISNTAPLTQTPGPASAVAVQLNPSVIPADGRSASVATATVTDAQGHRLTGEAVTFSSSDGGEKISATTNNGNGTYSAAITSSTTVGTAMITATDSTAHVSSTPVSLTQAAIPSTTTPSRTLLVTAPTTAVTNQTVTIIATVSAGPGSPVGAVTFERAGAPITGCGIVSVVPSSPSDTVVTVVCQTSFAASTSPELLTAVFTPGVGSSVAGSASAPTSLNVAPDATATTLAVSSTNPTAGNKVTYTATVTPARSGHAAPSGAIEFLDGTKAIGGCAARPSTVSGGSVTASCSVTYAAAGTHTISARYLGDPNFTTSTSAVAEVSVQKKTVAPLSRLPSTMQWAFVYTPSYMKILELVVDQVPLGANVLISCHGRGCPFAKHTYAVLKQTVCTLKSKGKCGVKVPSSTVDLQPAFRSRRLSVGTKLTIDVVRAGWIGKHYVFTVLSRRPPRTQIACLAPGSNRPGVGC